MQLESALEHLSILPIVLHFGDFSLTFAIVCDKIIIYSEYLQVNYEIRF